MVLPKSNNNSTRGRKRQKSSSLSSSHSSASSSSSVERPRERGRKSSPSSSSASVASDGDLTGDVPLSHVSQPFFFLQEEANASDEHSGFSSVLQRFLLERAHRRRRLVSQRRLGEAAPSDSSPFFLQRRAMNDDDAAMLLTFSNAELFYRLLEAVKSGECRDVQLDQLLSLVNPYFRYLCSSEADTGCATASPSPTSSLCESQFVRERVRPVLSDVVCRRRPASKPVSSSGRGRGGRGSGLHSKSGTGRGSGTAGLMQRSLQSWEQHLASELAQEGDTMENFRKNTAKESFRDREMFKERAAWNEYMYEMELQERHQKAEHRRRNDSFES